MRLIVNRRVGEGNDDGGTMCKVLVHYAPAKRPSMTDPGDPEEEEIVEVTAADGRPMEPEDLTADDKAACFSAASRHYWSRHCPF